MGENSHYTYSPAEARQYERPGETRCRRQWERILATEAVEGSQRHARLVMALGLLDEVVVRRAREEIKDAERDALIVRGRRLARLGRAGAALAAAWYALSPEELDPYQREEEEARADCEAHGDLEVE